MNGDAPGVGSASRGPCLALRLGLRGLQTDERDRSDEGENGSGDDELFEHDLSVATLAGQDRPVYGVLSMPVRRFHNRCTLPKQSCNVESYAAEDVEQFSGLYRKNSSTGT